jgi:mono/diheme cytochrome c family protein
MKRRIPVFIIPFVVAILVSAYVFLITERQRTFTFQFNEYENLQIPTSQEAIDHGRHLFVTRGCVDCHGEDGRGSVIQEGWFTGRIMAPNLTSGQGGIGDKRSAAEIIRAFREGVKPDSTSVLFMPAHKFSSLNEADVTAIAAYIKQMPAVDHELEPTVLSLPIRFGYMFMHRVELFPARNLRHPLELSDEIPVTDLEKGAYLASACAGCHGYGMDGGPIPGVPPTWPEAPSLRQDGPMANWTLQEFVTAMRQGVTPDGQHLDEDYMPWTAFGKLSDEELTLLFEYLQTLE